MDIIARGDNNNNTGDITINGGILKAGGNTRLTAARDINLLSAANTDTLSGKSSRHGSDIGLSAGIGRGGVSIGAYAHADKSRGHEKGNNLTHTETTIDSGGTVTLNSGQDATLQGAQVNGDRIIANIGRNLTLQSEQDSNDYHSKKTHQRGGVSATQGIATGGLTGASTSLNAKRDTMNSTYASVNEQTGLFAGNGGFNITVGNHTQLHGAVIASQADPSLNQLTTGTLGFSDIDNRAKYTVKHNSIGASTGGNTGGQFGGNLANDMLVGYKHSDSKNSTTHAAVSEGTITIRDPANQTQDIALLSRDTANANNVLNQIFDKEKEQHRLNRVQAIGEITRQTADIVRTEGAIAGEKAKTDPAKRREAKRQLEAEGKAVTEQSISQRAYNNAQRSTGTGSSVQQGITAAGSVIMGLAGGDWRIALADGASPYLAQQIHNMTMNKDGNVDTAANLTAHAIVNAALAIAKGGNATDAGVQASGAVSGEAMAMIATSLYNKKPNDLIETEKQTVSALSTLAGGLAGSLIGGNSLHLQAGHDILNLTELRQNGTTTLTEDNNINLGSQTISHAIDYTRNTCRMNRPACLPERAVLMSR